MTMIFIDPASGESDRAARARARKMIRNSGKKAQRNTSQKTGAYGQVNASG